MENRRKFYSSSRNPKNVLWSSDDLSKRFNHIKGALDAYNSGALNMEDLKFVIKNAFVSKIYISEAAVNHLKGQKHGNLDTLYDKLVSNGVLDLQDKINSVPSSQLSPYFDICKLGDRGLGVSIEHVVPGDVYLSNNFIKNPFKDTVFKGMFDKVSICIVTKEEAKDLDAKLRNEMPLDETSKKPIDYMSYPFARYDKALGGVDVKIHGWTIVKGNLIKIQ